MPEKKKKERIVPRKGYMLVLPDDPEENKTTTGLTIPSQVEKEQRAVGEVVEVSEEIADLKPGDRVVFGVYAGETIDVRNGAEKTTYRLLHDDDVIAAIR